MKAIILTSQSAEAIRLSKRLAELDESFGDIACLTKHDIHCDMDCDVIFSTWYMPQFSSEEVRTFFPRLKAIFYAAGTVKQFAEPFLANGIRVFSAAKANGVPVAEFATAQIILANKGYFQAQRRFRWPIWRRGFKAVRSIAECHSGNYDKKVGILGCGAIGSHVIRLLKPYDLSVMVYDPYLSQTKAMELGVSQASLKEIFSLCNVVSNHMPDIPETRGIINEELLQSMPKGATLINTGRGRQIDESALISVLKKRRDLTALLDVTVHEPPFPWSQLYWCKNIFMTPHIAGSLSDEVNRMIDFVYKSYLVFMNGGEPDGEVCMSQLKYNA